MTQEDLDKALSEASVAADVGKVRTLIKKGARVNAMDDSGRQPLHYATYYGRIDVMKLLIAGGAKIDAGSDQNNQPLHWAALQGHGEAAELLLARGAKVDAVNVENWRPLHHAAHTGRKEVVALLLEHGADPRVLNRKGHTPHAVCRDGEIKALLKKAVLEWKEPAERERDALADLRARLRHLGSLRPRVPVL